MAGMFEAVTRAEHSERSRVLAMQAGAPGLLWCEIRVGRTFGEMECDVAGLVALGLLPLLPRERCRNTCRISGEEDELERRPELPR